MSDALKKADDLYRKSLQSQAEMCFECSQYGPPGELRQCAECTVDLCRLCGDSESGLCVECQERENEDDEGASSLGGNPLKKLTHKVAPGPDIRIGEWF